MKISKEDQEEEDEFYQENPDAPPAMWSVGGWAEKKDEPRKKKRMPSKPEAGEIKTQKSKGAQSTRNLWSLRGMIQSRQFPILAPPPSACPILDFKAPSAVTFQGNPAKRMGYH